MNSPNLVLTASCHKAKSKCAGTVLTLTEATGSEGKEQFKANVGQVLPILQPIPRRVLLTTARNSASTAYATLTGRQYVNGHFTGEEPKDQGK